MRTCVALFLLMTFPVVGCLSLGDQSARVSVAEPLAGDMYNYESTTSGLSLEASVLGKRDVLDPSLGTQPSVVLRLELERSDVLHPAISEQAIDPASGLIVTDIAACGMRAWSAADRDHPGCVDERELVLFTQTGRPGALMLAPFWGRTLVSGKSTAVTWRTLDREHEISIVPSPSNVGPRSCLEVHWPAAVIDAPHGMPPGLPESFVACSGLALPERVRFAGGEEFVMRGSSPGKGPALPDEAPVQWSARADISLRSWSPPFLIDPDVGLRASISLADAHRAAQEQSPRYASLFKDASGLVIAGLVRQEGFGEDPGGIRHEFYNVVLRGTDGTGTLVRVEMNMRRTFAAPGLPPIEGALEVDNVSEETFPQYDWRSSTLPRQASVTSATRRVHEATGLDVHDAVMSHRIPSHTWSQGQEAARIDGYTILIWLRDPSPKDAGLEAPYEAVIDGPTGAVLWLMLDADALPGVTMPE